LLTHYRGVLASPYFVAEIEKGKAVVETIGIYLLPHFLSKYEMEVRY